MKYGNTKGRHRRFLYEYWPGKKQDGYRKRAIHFDPEFKTFTYGDPTGPKRSLRELQHGDILVFYAGLQPWSEVRDFTGNRTFTSSAILLLNSRVTPLICSRSIPGLLLNVTSLIASTSQREAIARRS